MRESDDSAARTARLTMNHSEKLALEYVEKTRAMMADPAYLTSDWSSTILIVAIALLVFVCVQLIVD